MMTQFYMTASETHWGRGEGGPLPRKFATSPVPELSFSLSIKRLKPGERKESPVATSPLPGKPTKPYMTLNVLMRPAYPVANETN